MLGLLSLGLGGLLFYHCLVKDRPARNLISLRRGASLVTLRRRATFKGLKGRRARRVLEAADKFCASIVRRPRGWEHSRSRNAPGPIDLYVLECSVEGPW